MNATLLQIQFFYHAAEEVYTSSARLDHVDPPAAQNGYYASGKAGAGPQIQPYPTIILRSVQQELSAVYNMSRPNMVPRDRHLFVQGTWVSVRVALGGRRI